MSAYLLYQNAMRDQFKRENPGMTFGQLAKYTSHMYKNLTAEEKETWQNRAQQDKTRYDAEICE
jgi:structure-specific recognition protein 1